MNRRDLFKQLLGGSIGILFGTKLIGKSLTKNSDFLNTTWYYSYKDATQIGSINGVLIWSWMFSFNQGYGSKSNGSRNVIRGNSAWYRTHNLLPSYTWIEPHQVMRCNVGEGWVEYYERDQDGIPVLNENGKLVYKRIELSDMMVNIVSKENGVICTLIRRNNNCRIEWGNK